MNRKVLIVAACMAIAPLSFSAFAQATTGNIIGEAASGDTILISNPDTGLKREVKVTKSGKYQLANLQPGIYQVIFMHADGSMEAPQQLYVRAGRASRAAPSSKSSEAISQ